MVWPRWPRDNPRDLARYVLPEAIYLLRQPDRSFDLAQQPDKLIQAIYDLLCNQHISYAREEFSTLGASQYIRTPEEILGSGKGTCLDLAVLFCGLCLGNNLLPLLILFEDHAIVTVSLNHDLTKYNAGDRKEIDDYFKNGVLDRDQLVELQKLVRREQYLAIECTGFAKANFRNSSYPESLGRVDGLLPFKQARGAGEAQLYNSNRKFRCAIDIAILQNDLDYEPYHSDRYLKLKNIQQPDRDNLLERRLQSFVPGTRERELEKVKELIEQYLPEGGYIAITGRAGQGKSSLAAKLVDDYSQKESIAYHFIPFHPGPAHQVALLRSIMATLALKHPYLPYLWVDIEDRGGLVDNFKAVLKEISKRGEREVIFIDGLDQILPESDTAKRDLSFLLEDLPPSIVIVVSTRPDDVLQPLQLKTSLKPYELPNLSQSDFEKLLEYRGLHLATEDINSLYEKLGGNALYLALVTQELQQVGSLSPGRLIKLLQDNPAELFGIALERLKSAKDTWERACLPVLGFLLVSVETRPLKAEELHQLLGGMKILPFSTLNDGLQRLGSLVEQNSQGGYYLYHLGLIEYLKPSPIQTDNQQYSFSKRRAQCFTEEELMYYHQQLANWCETGKGGLVTIWQDTKSNVTEQGRREYARQHYITHLYRAREWERLFTVLDTGEYGKAKVHHDPSTHSYVLDLNLGRLAAAGEDMEFEDSIQHLPNLWCYTLLRCSLVSWADRYPIEALEALVLLGREQDAINLADLLTDAVQKTSTLRQIAVYLGNQPGKRESALQLLLRASNVAGHIQDNFERAAELSKIAGNLAVTTEWEVGKRILEDALELAQTTSVEDFDALVYQALAFKEVAYALAAFGEFTPSVQFLIEASMRVMPIRYSKTSSTYRGLEDKVWTELRIALFKAGKQPRIINMLTKAVQALRSKLSMPDGFRGDALISKAEALATIGEKKLAIQLLHQIKDDFCSPIDFGDSIIERLIVLIKVAIVQFRYGEKDWRTNLLVSISKLLEANQSSDQEVIGILQRFTTALTEEENLKGSEVMAGAIADAELGDSIIQGMIELFFEMRAWSVIEFLARALKENNSKALVLSRLALSLVYENTRDEASRLLTEVTRAVKSVASIDYLNAALEIAQSMMMAGSREDADQILKDITSIAYSHPEIKEDILEKLVVKLVYLEQWERIDLIISFIDNPYWIDRVRFDLTKELIKIKNLDKALAIAQPIKLDSINNHDNKFTIVKEIAEVKLTIVQCDEIARIVRSQGNLSRGAIYSIAAIKPLIQHKESELATKLLEEASANIKLYDPGYTKFILMKELALGLFEVHAYDKANDLVTEIFNQRLMLEENSLWKEALYERLIPLFIRAGQLDKAKIMAYDITDNYTKKEAITKIAKALAEKGELDNAKLLVHSSFKETDEGTDTLIEIVMVLAKAGDLRHALALAKSLKPKYKKDDALEKIIQILAEKGELDKAESLTQFIKNDYQREVALATLAKALAREEKWDRAEAKALSIGWNHRKSEALCEVIEALAQAGKWSRAESLSKLLKDKGDDGFLDEDYQSIALLELVKSLARAREWKKAEAIANSINSNKKRVLALKEIIRTMTHAEEEALHLQLQLIQRMWLQVATRDYAIKLLPLSTGLLCSNPAIGWDFYKAFGRVDSFLAEA